MSAVPFSDELKRFRRTAWRFQQTFRTPLNELPEFVRTIVAAADGMKEGYVTLDEIALTPKKLEVLFERHSISAPVARRTSIMADGQEEVEELLIAALGDWVDFLFVPAPKPFVIYADHDEYITFYANTKSNLNRVGTALLSKGFKTVGYYTREVS